MPKNMNAVWAIVIAVTIPNAGCDRAPLPADPDRIDGRHSSSLQVPEGNEHAPVLRRMEVQLAQVAQEVPGFAGIYFKAPRRLVVALTDPSQGELAERVLRSVFAEDDRITMSLIEVVPVRHSFLQHVKWREALRPKVTRNSDVTRFGIVYAQNVLEVGGADTAAVRNSLRAELLRLRVPAEAVSVLHLRRPILRASLSDPFRPVPGGVRIRRPITNELPTACTLGFNTYIGTVRVFITNAHCTATIGLDENNVFHQPSAGDPSSRIGVEYRDPQFQSCSTYPPECRWSDAAAIAYDAGVGYQFGFLARTDTQMTDSTSTVIDPYNARLTITGREDWPIEGESLDKIGATSGWTTGRVSRICLDQPAKRTEDPAKNDYVTLKCQDFVTAGNRAGDSGAPVFQWDGGNGARLYGVLWGGASSTEFIFSSMWNIDHDLVPNSKLPVVYPGYPVQ